MDQTQVNVSVMFITRWLESIRIEKAKNSNTPPTLGPSFIVNYTCFEMLVNHATLFASLRRCSTKNIISEKHSTDYI